MAKVSNGTCVFGANLGSFLRRRKTMKKVMVVLLGCGLMLGITTISQADFTTLSMYHFDGTGNQQLIDSGPAGRNATKYNTPTTISGPSNNAFDFDVADDALYADWNYDLNQGFKLSFWFNVQRDDTSGSVLHQRLLELPGRFVLTMVRQPGNPDPWYHGRIRFQPIGPGIDSYSPMQSANSYNVGGDTSWHYIEITVEPDGNNLAGRMYIDGNFETNRTWTNASINTSAPSGTGNDKLWFASSNLMATTPPSTAVGSVKLDEVKIEGVPEPATIGLLTFGVFNLLRRR